MGTQDIFSVGGPLSEKYDNRGYETTGCSTTLIVEIQNSIKNILNTVKNVKTNFFSKDMTFWGGLWCYGAPDNLHGQPGSSYATDSTQTYMRVKTIRYFHFYKQLTSLRHTEGIAVIWMYIKQTYFPIFTIKKHFLKNFKVVDPRKLDLRQK